MRATIAVDLDAVLHRDNTLRPRFTLLHLSQKTRDSPKHSRQSQVGNFLVDSLAFSHSYNLKLIQERALDKMSETPQVHTPIELPNTPDSLQFHKRLDGSPKEVIAPASPLAIVDEKLGSSWETFKVSL